MAQFVYSFKDDKHNLSFTSDEGETAFLSGFLRGFPKGSPVLPDKPVCCVSEGSQSITFGNLAQLTISKQTTCDVKQSECFRFSFKSLSPGYYPEIDLDLEPSVVHWYGGSELFTQQWPMKNIFLPEAPYLSTDYVIRDKDNRVSGPVLERYWINSRGVGIYVDPNVPLHVSWDSTYEGRFRVKAKFENSQYASVEHPDDFLPTLDMSFFKSSNVKTVHQAMSAVCFKKPLGMPDERMISSPIWSTWATFKTDIDQDKVLTYAREIQKHGFSHSQLELDDMTSRFYGDLDFSDKKFKDPKSMISELKNLGFRVTVWVTPFANLDSQAFKEGVAKGYFIMDPRGEVPALVKWWQGIGAIVDLTNPAATEWYSNRLRKLQTDYGVDSFKFDAGEIGYLPLNFKTHRPMKAPGEYTTLYNKLIHSFGGMVEMRSTFMSQEYANFVRVIDKDSCWGYGNGLQSLIPSVLTIGLLGYPYVLPDMIGGNAYGEHGEFLETVLPDRELFIRWLEVTAYLPSMQFSVVPWHYDDEVVQIAKKFVEIHEKVVTPRLLEALKEANANGTPLIRPIWWESPEDEDALQVDSQFMVGDNLLVAPVVEDGRRERNVYLPAGMWMDEINNSVLDGGRWYHNYQVKLEQVATFVRQ